MTLQMLLELLPYEYEKKPAPEVDPVLNMAELYDKNRKYDDLPHLFLARLSDALTAEKAANYHFLCIRDRLSDGDENDASMQGVIVINKNIPFEVLFNTVQESFFNISTWTYHMQLAVSTNLGFQKLLDMSESVIGNYITVCDATYKVYAHTQGIQVDDPLAKESVRLGYYPRESINLMRKVRGFENIEKANETELLFSPKGTLSPYDGITRVFRWNDSYVLIIMLCCKMQPSKGLNDLFMQLTENINYFLKESSFFIEKTPRQSWLSGILANRISSRQELEISSSHINFPFTGAFGVWIIEFKDADNSPLSFLVGKVNDQFPDAIPIKSENQIVMLIKYGDKVTSGTYVDEIYNRLEKIFVTYPVLYGVSNVFNDLTGIIGAMEQAKFCAQIGNKIINKDLVSFTSSGKSNLFVFYHYILAWALISAKNSNPDIYENSWAHTHASDLAKYSKNHNLDYIKLLSVYLRNERNAGITAKVMHVHRNTILYHIQKIEDFFHISFDEPLVRENMNLGIQMFELEQCFKQ